MTADVLLGEAPAGVPYVYFLLADDGAVVYIGSTRHLRRRLSQHRRDKAWWAEVAFIRAFPHASLDAALDAERRYLAAANPRHNRTHRGPGMFGMACDFLAGVAPSSDFMDDLSFVERVRTSVREPA